MAAKCYAGKVLYVDLSSKELIDIPIGEKAYEKFVGGKGLATKLLLDYVNPKADPLSEENALIVMSGALNPYMPKFTVTSKSPLTDTVCTSNCGGSFGSMLKKAGYDGVIIQGKADSLSVLKIDDKVSIEDAGNLELKVISEAVKELPDGYSKLVIGPAGENLVRFASISSDGRFAGRGGLGAVLGSKNLKAIIAKGDKDYDFGDDFKEFYINACKEWSQHARVQSLKDYGTANLVLPGALLGYTPVENYRKASPEDVENFGKISGEEFAKHVAGNASCKKCPVGCGKTVSINGKAVKRPEYESIAFLGPNLGNYDKESVARLNELCDELGLDTISTGAVLGYAMSTKVFHLAFGYNKNLEYAIKNIAYKKSYGTELSQGVKRLSKMYGQKNAMHVKGMEIAAYVPDSRILGQVLGYLTNPRGGCHLNAPTAADELTLFAPLEPDDVKGKPELIAFLESVDNMMDSMGMCRFTAYALIKKKFKMPHKAESRIFRNFPNAALMSIDVSNYYDLLSSATGRKYGKKSFLEIGKHVANMEHSFNRKAGHKIEEESLPEGLLKNLTKDGDAEKGRELLNKMLGRYFEIMGK